MAFLSHKQILLCKSLFKSVSTLKSLTLWIKKTFSGSEEPLKDLGLRVKILSFESPPWHLEKIPCWFGLTPLESLRPSKHPHVLPYDATSATNVKI